MNPTKSKRNHKIGILYISIAMMTVLLNVMAWNSTAFCDAYLSFVFPIWVNFFGRITNLFRFSVGEWMIVAGILLVMIALLLAIVILFLWVVGVLRRKKIAIRQYFGSFYIFLAWVLLIVCVVMTGNCTILYHGSTFSDKYLQVEESSDSSHTLEELFLVRNYVVEQCNRLAKEVDRDLDGNILYRNSFSKDGRPLDMEDKAREVMQELGKRYKQLDGWYPRPKPLYFSDFLCQQYMEGYYFPFSMEANYNDVMYIMNKPATMCHELAHLKGFIYEDEANFIGYLACVQSDNLYFQYSGYLSVLYYLNNDLNQAYRISPKQYIETADKVGLVAQDEVIWRDNIFVTPAEWDRINEKTFLETEKVDAAADVFLDTTLKVNGIADGMFSYDRVVQLLLQYYKDGV